MIVVSGRLQIKKWTDKDGNKRHSAEIVADSVYFGESKKDRDAREEKEKNTWNTAPTYSDYAPPAFGQDWDDDDAQWPF
jgi:single-strand DNA-binding protein